MKCAKCLENYIILSIWEFWPTIPSMLQLVNKGVIEEERWRILCKIFFTLISPLTSKRDWHPMCCYSKESSGLLDKFSLSASSGNV